MSGGRSPRALILRRARIRPRADESAASSLAIVGGRIVAVGSDADAYAAVGSDAPTVDLRGKVILPGFIDAHLHWTGYAMMRQRLVLEPSDGLSDVQRRVRQRTADLASGAWLLGRGWDHTAWGRWPTAADLDVAAPGHPVALTRKDGHVLWLNSAAMAAAGIDATTPDPPGGAIEREGLRPTGILKETAKALALRAVPPPEPWERQAAMVEAWPTAWCRGLTGAHDMGYDGHAVFRDLATIREAGDLGLRFAWYLPEPELDEAIGLGLRSGLGDEWLRVGGLKLFLDGTLGAQTAAMLAPYEDQPGNTGIDVLDPETLSERVARAASAGLATAAHAIGDRAVRNALDAMAAAPRLAPAPLRHRVEHAQLVDPADVPRFAALDVVASMQPIHATVDMPIAERHWGARTAHGYPWRGLLNAGARLAFGSDAPIETLDVFAGIHAALTRQTADGNPRGGWHPAQRLDIVQALHAYTLGAAWASGQEVDLGSLEAGKCADLIVLDRDPLELAPSELLRVRVLGTMIEGVWVWQAPGTDLAGPRSAA